MPVKKGKLKPADYEVIRKNLSYIVEQVEAKDIADDLFSKNIFTSDDVDVVCGLLSRGDRTRKMCYLLLQSGPYEAFSTFMELLRETYPHVAERLELSAEEQESLEVNPWAWFDALPSSLRDEQIDDPLASRISACLGDDWEHIFLGLGIRNVKISQEKAKHPRSTSLVITNLLIHWRQWKTSGATLNAFVSALRNTSCEVDIAELENVLKPSNAIETDIF